MSDLFGNHIVGFPTRRLNYIDSVTYIMSTICGPIFYMYIDFLYPSLRNENDNSYIAIFE